MWYFSADRSINPCSVSSPSMNIEHTFRTHTMLNSLKIDKEKILQKHTHEMSKPQTLSIIFIALVVVVDQRYCLYLEPKSQNDPHRTHIEVGERALTHMHTAPPHMLVLLSTSQSTNQMRLLNQILIDNCSYNLTSFG